MANKNYYSKIEQDFLSDNEEFLSFTPTQRYYYLCIWNFAVCTGKKLLNKKEMVQAIPNKYHLNQVTMRSFIRLITREERKKLYKKPLISFNKTTGDFCIHGVDKVHDKLLHWEKPENDDNGGYDYSDVDAVIDYLNKVKGSQYKHSDSSRRYIRPRLEEGYTKEDCFKVIDHKCVVWKKTDFEKYIRPVTLFCASKFGGYLDEANQWIKRGKLDPNKPGGGKLERFR